MSDSIPSRRYILDRIRTATKANASNAISLAGEYSDLSRTYIRAGRLPAVTRIALMIERLRDYDTRVAESTRASLPFAIATQLVASGKNRFIAPQGLPAEWLVPSSQCQGIRVTIDYGLTRAEIDEAEGVVTASFCGVADSGTIALHHSETEGRRVLSLLPDWHLCILYSSQVVETLPEYFERISKPPSLATYISGPSATADIEMTRIKGVHGPRSLHVILVHDQL